ncbi:MULTISPECIES: transcriptional regulator GcvA [Curvibacter]|jgi:LysR family glycine cleavage system transcriptional activator|uniref:transcriptional regulator GcvA n=1 Tax=Curvibacter TaxID=281915 RepID=UPI0004B34F69|nr:MULTISPECIES: transcriptional regulator GcvA [Curvibacter]MBV5291458.1 transcriptional regulator GcvA [Curvibacter lanceolatus]
MRRKIPSTSALSAFEAAARHSSFTEAANELALTQSAICRQIGGLEEFLGVKLFRRTRRGVLLTEAGEVYHRQVTQRLDDVERDTLDLMARQGRGGRLDLAVVPTFGTRWLIPRLADFSKRHPDITINLSSRTRPFLFDDTRIDAAIYAGDGNWPGATTTCLMQEALIPVCSPALIAPRRQLTPQELAQLPLLQQSTRPYAWRQWFESVGHLPGNELAGPSYELFFMSLEAAAVGLGVALVPEYDLGSDIDSGRLIIPIHHVCPSDRAYYLAYPEHKAESPTLKLFKTWLVEETRDLGAASPPAASGRGRGGGAVARRG